MYTCTVCMFMRYRGLYKPGNKESIRKKCMHAQ